MIGDQCSKKQLSSHAVARALSFRVELIANRHLIGLSHQVLGMYAIRAVYQQDAAVGSFSKPVTSLK